MLLNGRTSGHEISHKDELDLCADAARRNVNLWHRLSSLQRPARLSSSSVHYLFNAALALQLYQILVDSQAQGDYEEVSFVISLLGVDESSNREYAKDCANVLADLSSLMGRLRSVDLPKKTSRPEAARRNHRGVDSSPSNGTGSGFHQEFQPHPNPHPISDAPKAANGSPYDHREVAYNELLSWLEADSLQHKIDFPDRFG